MALKDVAHSDHRHGPAILIDIKEGISEVRGLGFKPKI